MNPITILLFVFIISCLILFLFAQRLKVLLSLSLNVFLVVFVFLMLTAILLPNIYVRMADGLLVQTGTYGLLTGVDSSLTDTVNSPQQFIKQLAATLNIQVNIGTNKVDVLEKQVYPGIVDLVSNIVRVVAVLLSALGMTTVVYLRFLYSDIAELNKLKHDQKEVEDRLRKLEEESI